MLWKNFLECYEESLYDLWHRWVPLKDEDNIYEEDYEDNYQDEDYDYDYVDYGDRVMSFENFVCCAYENSIS